MWLELGFVPPQRPPLPSKYFKYTKVFLGRYVLELVLNQSLGLLLEADVPNQFGNWAYNWVPLTPSGLLDLAVDENGTILLFPPETLLG